MILFGDDFGGSGIGAVRGHRRAHSGLAGVDGLGDVEVKVGSGWNADEDALALHRVGDLLRVEVGSVLHALCASLLEPVVLRRENGAAGRNDRLQAAFGKRLREAGAELRKQHFDLGQIVGADFLAP